MTDNVTISIITGTTALSAVAFKFFLDKFKKVNKKKPQILTAEESTLFSFLDKLEIDIIMNFKVSNDVSDYKAKEAAFKDIMINKIRIWRTVLIKLVQKVRCTGNCDNCETSLIESRKLHMNTLSEGILVYTSYYKNDNKYTKNEVKALDVCMEKFNILHAGNTQTVENMIDLTHQHNKYFKRFCPIMAMGLILDAYKSAFYQMQLDVTKSINSLNGDLKGIIFNRRNY